MSDRKLIWQPEGIRQSTSQFKIRLAGDFALETLQMIGTDYRVRFQEMAEEISRPRGCSNRNPFIFHEDTYFARQINLGTGGTSLTVDDLAGKTPSGKDLIYTFHNATEKDAITAMKLFELWVDYKDATRETPG